MTKEAKLLEVSRRRRLPPLQSVTDLTVMTIFCGF